MTPQAKSQQKRTAAANELAQALGFETMAKMVTAYKAGRVIVSFTAEDSTEITARITIKK